MMRTALAPLALALSLVASARAGGFPTLDPAAETIVIGPDVPVVAADTNGSWATSPGRVAPSGGKKGQHHFFFPRIGPVTDGFVRARFVAGAGGVDAALVLRGSPPDTSRDEPTGALSGWVVVVAPDEARLERWELGMRRALVPPQKVKAKAGVEIVAWMIGPHLHVELYDTTTLASIASFAATDPQRPTGRVGIYTTGAGADRQALVLLTVRAAKIEGAARDTPAGPQRYLALGASAMARLAALPSEARALFTTMEPRADGAVVRTTVEGHELLARDGVPLDWLGSDTPFKYVDKGYLAARARGVEATRSGFRLDRSYKDHAMVEALLRAYHQRFPSVTRLVELGRSPAGRSILALVVSDHPERHEANEPTVFLNGAHHGNELLPTDFVLDAAQTLLERGGEPDIRRFVHGLEIWLVPLVNPDGNDAFWNLSLSAGRKNVRDTDGNGRFDPTDGVDLNRNYPFAWGALGESASRSFARAEYHRGPAPASEPEVRALMRLVDATHPAASISYHTVSNVILVPYTTDGPKNPEPNEAWVIAEAIAKDLPTQPTGRRMGVAKKIYAVDGVDQDHFRAAHGTVALLVEGAYHNPLGHALRAKTITTTRGTWTGLFERVLTGPGIAGHTLDEAGQPLVAEVVVRELAPKNGELWTSRCADGRFDRLVPRAGTYTVDVRAPGYLPVTRRVAVAAKRPTALDLRLARDPAAAVTPLCGDPALMSIDQTCACQAGACLEPGPPRWCRIAGRCVAAGAREAAGVCDPGRSQIAWSRPRFVTSATRSLRASPGQA